MLDLHLVEQHVPVLRDLDVTGAAHLEEVKEVEEVVLGKSKSEVKGKLWPFGWYGGGVA